MKQISKNPYQNNSFEDFMNDKVAFIDKTEYIQTLYDLDSPYPILVRPHGFGKSLFIQMLYYYHDEYYKDRYDDIFKGTRIHELNSVPHNFYHVIKFDFSKVNGTTCKEILTNFNSCVFEAIDDFLRRYPKVKFKREHYENLGPGSVIDGFLSQYALDYRCREHKVYVMIDGYDAFLEPFLGKELDAEFKNALSYIISFYASLKSLTCDMIAKIFITGCISIGLDYFNIACNEFFLDDFNEYCGFNKHELTTLIEKLIDLKALNTSSATIADNLSLAYGGYSFSYKGNRTVINPSFCLKYLKKVRDTNSLPNPKEVIENELKLNNDLLKIIIDGIPKIDLKVSLDSNYDVEEKELLERRIKECINIKYGNEIDPLDYLSIFYYLGFLTQSPSKFYDEVHLVFPNEPIQRIVEPYFTNALKYDYRKG